MSTCTVCRSAVLSEAESCDNAYVVCGVCQTTYGTSIPIKAVMRHAEKLERDIIDAEDKADSLKRKISKMQVHNNTLRGKLKEAKSNERRQSAVHLDHG
jgi:L-lactate utilization protein LutB